MSFRITGLDPEPFQQFFGLSDDELAARGIKRYIADTKPGFPDRIEVRDAEPGERLLLLNYVHQPAETPYRSSHAIFVLEGATQRYEGVDEIPEVIQRRQISLRAFNSAGEMIAGDLVDGAALAPLIDRFFADPNAAYLHAHYAKRGCYAARIDRI